ncbi:MAG: GDSL family lipase [Armatimonadetes bacterium]|nr:GDSL family lipase [Armatimonadota bacterium]
MIATALAALMFGMQENPACVPVENEAPTKAGSYDWMARHHEVLDLIKTGQNFEFALIGDSITHGWGGVPKPGKDWAGGDPEGYDKLFGPYHPINLGFGWDQTGHVLWRIQHGELDGITLKGAMLAIGTNNLGWHTNEQVYGGIVAVVDAIRAKQPKAKILVLGILPRAYGGNKDDMARVSAVNKMLADKKWGKDIRYADTGAGFLDESGQPKKALMDDLLHPNHVGYEVWGKAIEPVLRDMMGR